MSGTYKATGGESWNTVARRSTGNDTDAAAIKRANPGLIEPLTAGNVVQVPMAQKNDGAATTSSELDIVVDGQAIGTFDNFELAVSIDAISKGGFTVPNEPETRLIFTPLESQLITVDYFGARILTGRCETPKLNNTPNEKTLDVPFYSEPAILESCTPQITAFPLEWEDTEVGQIASDLCDKHGISVRHDAPLSARFKRVDIQTGEAILGFLSGLCSQRGLIICDSPEGEVVLHDGRSVGTPVAYLEATHPHVSIKVSIDESRYYSSVTGTMPAKSKRGKKGASFTVDNPHAADIIRTYTFEAKDIEAGELEDAVNSAAGRMFSDVMTIGVEVATWTNDLEDLYWPGQTAFLKSEIDFIPDFYEFLITGVTFHRSAGSQTASLALSLPGVFTGEIPERMPWQQ